MSRSLAVGLTMERHDHMLLGIHCSNANVIAAFDLLPVNKILTRLLLTSYPCSLTLLPVFLPVLTFSVTTRSILYRHAWLYSRAW